MKIRQKGGRTMSNINLTCCDSLYSLKFVDGEEVNFTVDTNGDLFISIEDKEFIIDGSDAKRLYRFLKYAISESTKKENEQ